MRSTFTVLLFDPVLLLAAFCIQFLSFLFISDAFNLFIVYWDLNWLPLLVCCMPCNSIIFRHHVYRPPNYPLRFFFSDRIKFIMHCVISILFLMCKWHFLASYSSHCSSAAELVYFTCVLRWHQFYPKNTDNKCPEKKNCAACEAHYIEKEMGIFFAHVLSCVFDYQKWDSQNKASLLMFNWLAESESLEIFSSLLRMIYLDLGTDMCYIMRKCDD